MDPVLVVSPHLDDAVLSVGSFLASWPGAWVLTVFAGTPSPAKVTSFDVHCGFVDSDVAMPARWDEDDRALAAVGARPLRASLLDGQYDPERDSDETIKSICKVLHRSVLSLTPTRVLVPLGLAHPDHELVSIAATIVAREWEEIELWAYEDVPSRVLWPEQVPIALDRWKAAGFDPVLGFMGGGDNTAKRAAVGCYTSQLWALNHDVLYVPERTWRMW